MTNSKFESCKHLKTMLWHPWNDMRFSGPQKARKCLMPLAFRPVASLVYGIHGGRYKTRTCDLPHVKRMRYQLRQSSNSLSAKSILPHGALLVKFFPHIGSKKFIDKRRTCSKQVLRLFHAQLTRYTVRLKSVPLQLTVRLTPPLRVPRISQTQFLVSSLGVSLSRVSSLHFQVNLASVNCSTG